MKLLVSDILKRPHFQNIDILAGHNGLSRPVKWVHIVEIETFGHLLNGQEVILTTGVEWMKNQQKHFLQQLIDHNVSALCIELDKNTGTLTKKMLDLADQHDFPIISFNKEVRFIDITKDIHEVLLGYQENFWWDLEKLSDDFNQILISNGSINLFLKKLHHVTNKNILLYDRFGQYLFFPTPSKNKREKWKIEIDQNKLHYYSIPIYLQDEKVAQIYVLEADSTLSLFNQLAVKRCGEFLSQYFWKYRQQEEIQKVKKNEWIIDAISGEISNEEVIKKLLRENPEIRLNEAILAIIPDLSQSISKQNNESILAETVMLMRTIFKNEGFHLIATRDTERNFYILLLINQSNPDESPFNRLNNALSKIYELSSDTLVSENLHLISFGKIVNDYNQIQDSYQTALSTLNFQRNLHLLEEPFYHKIGLYRVVEQIHDTSELKEMINDYISPLIAYDLEKGTELLKSLQVYLKNLGSKNETARELFIVRQTLYHRLDKIKELLGEDYMNHRNRVMIEFAIYALEYLETAGLESAKSPSLKIY